MIIKDEIYQHAQDYIKNYHKKHLKELLIQCTDEQKLMFKRMYGSHVGASISDIVDKMTDTKINTAIKQVERTIEKNGNKI